MIDLSVDLKGKLRQALENITDVYLMFEEPSLDVVAEASWGFHARSARFVTGLQTSALSKLLHFEMPQGAGPENLTLSLTEQGHLAMELTTDVEWIALQAFLKITEFTSFTLYIDTLYSLEQKGTTLPIEYFVRAFSPNHVQDTPPHRQLAVTGTPALTRYRYDPDMNETSFGNRICLITYLARPPRRMVIERLRIYCLP